MRGWKQGRPEGRGAGSRTGRPGPKEEPWSPRMEKAPGLEGEGVARSEGGGVALV